MGTSGAPTLPPCLAFAHPRANQIIKSFHGLLESSQTAKFTYAYKSNNISSNKGQRSSKDNHIMGVQKLIQYYSTTLTFSRQLEYRQHLLFLPSLEVFLFFKFLEAK